MTHIGARARDPDNRATRDGRFRSSKNVPGQVRVELRPFVEK